jgi:hypothetical protein
MKNKKLIASFWIILILVLAFTCSKAQTTPKTFTIHANPADTIEPARRPLYFCDLQCNGHHIPHTCVRVKPEIILLTEIKKQNDDFKKQLDSLKMEILWFENATKKGFKIINDRIN